MVRYRGAGRDEAGMPAHELYQSHAVMDATRFGMRALENFGRFLNGSEISVTARDNSHVVIDRFRNTHHRKGVTAAPGLLKQLLTAPLGAISANGEQDMHAARDQVLHSSGHVDRTTRSA